MSDRTNIGGSYRRRLFPTRQNLYVAIAVCAMLFLGILVGGNLYGRYLATLEDRGRENAIEQMRAESQQQKRKIDEQSAELTNMQAKLNGIAAELESIRPTANTYNISPNQTFIVGDGRLTIGMIGAPGNDSITLSINGRQQTVSAGQVINVAPDPSANCQVGLQSFDMFKAVLVASCRPARQQ